ncbi:MAG: nucleotidyltransferase family protein [Undibacterium sp.]|nr:nucleotidyltransferase family protein [Undibacterium sp.]
MDALSAAKSLNLSNWAIGAGAIRNLVWDHLHGHKIATPLRDIDVVFYDDTNNITNNEPVLQQRLKNLLPELNWEVVNQATVHHWLQQHVSSSILAFQSIEQGIAAWPEYATCVAVHIDPHNQLQCISPHGLEDLFNLRVRHNPTVVGYAVYQQRLLTKRFHQRWPQLDIITQ